MKRDDLDRLLRQSHVPELPDAYWDAFPGRVVRSLQTDAKRRDEPRHTRFVITTLAAAAGAFAILSLSLWISRPQPSLSGESLKDGRILGVMLAKFPGRLRAVTRDNKGLHTLLSSTTDVATSDPVWLEIREGGSDRVIATFSGQTISTERGNAIVLTDRSGHVMLIGDAFFWSQEVSAGLPGDIRLQAAQIPESNTITRPPPPL
jgi:hypothetical protein